MLGENMTLLEEIDVVGEIRHLNCTLKICSGNYVMTNQDDITQRHVLAVETTNENRLIAHWEGFKRATQNYGRWGK